MPTEFPEPKFQIDIEDAKGIAIGDGSMVIQHLQEEWLIEETLDDIKADSFVPPSNDKTLLTTLRTQHLLVICGANRMGKAALSRYVAFRLEVEQGSWDTYRMRRRSELQDLVDGLSLQNNTTILVYDTEPLEFDDTLQSVQETAVKTGNYVIMTTDVSKENLQLPVECKACIVQVTLDSHYTRADLRLLLQNRIGHLLPQLTEREMSVQDLIYGLGSPSQIVRFSEMVSAGSQLPGTTEIKEMIRTLQNVDLEISRWLSSLDKNERYLAISLALLDDLSEKRFWMLYEEMVSIWQKRDFTLLPLDYYALEKFKGFVSLGPRFTFQESEYRNTLLNVLLPQYRRSLAAILPFFREVAERDDGAHKMSRIAVAQAVGAIGAVEWPEVEEVLLSWAVHRSARVRASTSHAFREMLECLGLDSLRTILARLNQWLSDHLIEHQEHDADEKHNIRWTVASSLGRIGRIVSQQDFVNDILPMLSELAWDEDYRVRRSVVYAMRSLAISRLAVVEDILNERAADWHPAVRSEVATVICELSAVRWTEARNLLLNWMEDRTLEKHWTVLWTILQLGREHPDLIEDLYKLSERNSTLDSNLNTILPDLLEQDRTDDQILARLEVLVRDDIPDDSFLIIKPMVEALDQDYPNSKQLIQRWESSPKLALQQVALAIMNELNAIKAERENRWRDILKNYLTNEEELQAFAATLPPPERDAFWRDVEEAREERKKATNRIIRIVLITAGILFVVSLCLAIYFSTF
jgi:hypothetical protein